MPVAAPALLQRLRSAAAGPARITERTATRKRKCYIDGISKRFDREHTERAFRHPGGEIGLDPERIIDDIDYDWKRTGNTVSLIA
jgi:hypothetical protein